MGLFSFIGLTLLLSVSLSHAGELEMCRCVYGATTFLKPTEGEALKRNEPTILKCNEAIPTTLHTLEEVRRDATLYGEVKSRKLAPCQEDENNPSYNGIVKAIRDTSSNIRYNKFYPLPKKQ